MVAVGGRLVIVGTSPGDVEGLDSSTGYGSIVVSLFGGLARRHEVVLRSVGLRGAGGALNLLRSVALQPGAWRQYSRLNPWVFRMRSRRSERAVRRLGEGVDVVLQWQGLNAPFLGKPLKPSAIYTDYTTRLRDGHQHAAYRSSFYRSERERAAYYRLEGDAYRRAGRVFTYNELVRRSMIEDYGVEAERVINVGVGVCMEPMDPTRVKRTDSRQVLFIGKDSAAIRKGVPTLLEGFAQVREAMPEARLVLVGLSAERVPPLPGVVNMGFIRDRKRLREVLENAAVFAMTPLIDPSPGVVREAMAMKLPVVASAVDGIPEMVVDGETGYLVPPESPGELARAIMALLGDEGKMRRMGERGYARVLRHFTWGRVLGKMEPHLVALCEDGTPPGRGLGAGTLPGPGLGA